MHRHNFNHASSINALLLEDVQFDLGVLALEKPEERASN